MIKILKKFIDNMLSKSRLNNENVQIISSKNIENKDSDNINLDFSTLNKKIFEPLLKATYE